MNCPYCNGQAILKDSSIVYGRSYGMIWICENYPKCDSFVGTHKATLKPLGTLANAELRALRIKCHAEFDKLWKEKNFKRQTAYKHLAKFMKIDEPHFGEFTKEQCEYFLTNWQYEN